MTTKKGRFAIDKMSPDSRVWVYQANKLLSTQEAAQIRLEVSRFIKGWKAHGNELMAECTITKQQFLIVALDESFSQASGCSIDSCVRKIQEIGAVLKVDFMDKSRVVVQEDDNSLSIYNFQEIPNLVKEGKITPDSLVFNNTIQKLSQLKTDWIRPASKSWLSKYFIT